MFGYTRVTQICNVRNGFTRDEHRIHDLEVLLAVTISTYYQMHNEDRHVYTYKFWHVIWRVLLAVNMI